MEAGMKRSLEVQKSEDEEEKDETCWSYASQFSSRYIN